MKTLILLLGILVAIIALNSCKPIATFLDSSLPESSFGPTSMVELHPDKKTVVIVAHNEGTEIFDLLAPFNIMSYDEQLNVFIISPEKSSIPLWKGISIFPHFSFEEFVKTGLQPDLVIVPNMLQYQDQRLHDLIRNYQSDSMMVLSVCEGSRVIAESKLFEEAYITSHHSSINKQQKEYPNLRWVKGSRFVESGKLLSTSGVAAAVEGSLMTMNVISSAKNTDKILKRISYPSDSIRLITSDKGMGFGDVMNIVGKTGFRSNKKLAIYLPENFEELQVAAIIDTYNRSFPKSLYTFTQNTQYVTSKNGLLAVPNVSLESLVKVDEIIIPVSEEDLTNQEKQWLYGISNEVQGELIYYNQQEYIFHQLYERIKDQYGRKYAKTVFRLLDYDIEPEV
ncbi:MAG: DJ-1/PfpI family protein [Cyclobacteriaceae bacterium]